MVDTTRGNADHPSPGGQLADLTSAAREARAAESRAAADRLTACYDLFRECIRAYAAGATEPERPGYAVIDPFDVCAGQIVSAMAISSTRAETMLSFAADLHERFPAILAALAAGRMDQNAAELLVRQMATVDPAVLALVQRQVVDDYLASLDAGIRLGAQAVRDAVDAIISRHDADGIRERRKAASRDRGVSIRKGTDGMSTMWANLAADEAAVLAEAIDQRVSEHEAAEAESAASDAAASVSAASESAAGHGTAAGAESKSEPVPHYSKAERRADALLSLVCGDIGLAGGQSPTEGTDSSDEEASGAITRLRPKVTVIAGGDVGDGGSPSVEFARTGRAAFESLLDMLATCDGASIERIDPTPGAADDPDRARRYRPSAELARRIRLRDGTCRHPGCCVPASECEIDHARPFDHADPARGGQTTESDLMLLCRRHHRFKTFSDWKYDLRSDGTLIVRTSDGTSMITRPSGPLARYRQEQQRVEDEAWDRQQARMPDRTAGEDCLPAEPTYWTRRHARLRAERRRVERERLENELAETTGNAAGTCGDAAGTGGDVAGTGGDNGDIAHTAGAPISGNPAAGDHTASDSIAEASRWWARNAPVTSTIERDIESLLEELLDPPPF